MNKIISKFLLARAKLMPELHLKHPRFTKHCERIPKFRETGNQNIYIEMN